MSTTTLRLPQELRERVAKLAEESGTTAHGFMLEAIAERVANEELRHEFLAVGKDRLANMLTSGLGLEWAEMRDYLGERAAGHAPTAPEIKRWRG
jgi:predicted DNA-binding protein